MKSNFQFQMIKQSLEDGMRLSKTKLSDASASKATMEEEIGKASGEMVEAKKTKMADSMYLSSLQNECEDTAEAWEERQKSAAAECAAIDKAKDILQSRVKAMLQVDGANSNAGKGKEDEENREDREA